jgi:hypothetical protein
MRQDWGHGSGAHGKLTAGGEATIFSKTTMITAKYANYANRDEREREGEDGRWLRMPTS